MRLYYDSRIATTNKTNKTNKTGRHGNGTTDRATDKIGDGSLSFLSETDMLDKLLGMLIISLVTLKSCKLHAARFISIPA
uniref:Uncharacterized protein n=1 Tax=mine drainage metagenome TaxID=410659 RepID=E6QE36_9ZZZZ